MVEAQGLADSWPEDGPPRLWHRELGDGYATITADGGMLFTMYRSGEDEVSVALDAETGATVWEHRNPSPPRTGTEQFGFGPNSSPLITGGRVFTLGANAVLHCLAKDTGKVIWKHDLAAEFNAPTPHWSYSCSAIAYDDMVIIPVDRVRENDDEKAEGEAEKAPVGQSLIAFDQATGEVVWKTQDHAIAHSSPILIDFDRQKQLVLLMAEAIVGVDPHSGKLLWSDVFEKPEGNMATPLKIDDDLIFYSNPSGSRMLKLTKKNGEIVPEELWKSKRLRINHANPIHIGDLVFGSSGADPAFITCLNVKTGKREWIARGFGKATCVLADGKVIILDQEGYLALGTATEDGLTIHSKCKIAEPYAWAAPTLVGKTLYVRDRKHIMAFDLG